MLQSLVSERKVDRCGGMVSFTSESSNFVISKACHGADKQYEHMIG